MRKYKRRCFLERSASFAKVDQIVRNIKPAYFPDRNFKLSDFLTSARHAILQAINACHIVGGGKVIEPAGTWLLDGLTHLKSCTWTVELSYNFNVGDDSVALKAGLDQDGWCVGKLCERIVIRNNHYSGNAVVFIVLL